MVLSVVAIVIPVPAKLLITKARETELPSEPAARYQAVGAGACTRAVDYR